MGFSDIIYIQFIQVELHSNPAVLFLLTDWKQEYRDADECLHVDPMVKCKQNNYMSTMQPTTNLPTDNSTTNSTSNGRR